MRNLSGKNFPDRYVAAVDAGDVPDGTDKAVGEDVLAAAIGGHREKESGFLRVHHIASGDDANLVVGAEHGMPRREVFLLEA